MDNTSLAGAPSMTDLTGAPEVAGRVPRLSRSEMDRLVEVGTTGWTEAALKPTTSAKLVLKGMVEPYQQYGKNQLELTHQGIEVLAGLPGDRFAKFRAALAATDPTP